MTGHKRTVPTFEEALEKVIAVHRAGRKDGSRQEELWRATLRDYAVPKLGGRPVDRITTSDVMEVLLPIRNEKRVTARRVFPSARNRPLPGVAMSAMVRKLGIGAVPHGFRSSFRDWAAECSDAPREVCELALAHVNTNAIEAAYRRTDLFERRRALMEQWAAFLAGSGDARGSGTNLPS